MYSVVLMMAMTSGGDVADLGHRHGGCCGGESYSCCGGVSYGCCGGYSCCGGGHHRHHRHHRGGCCGGEAYYGCCGGYSGCCGGYAAYSGCCGGAVYTGAPVIVGEDHEMHDGKKDDGKKDDGKKDGGKSEEELKTKPKPEASASAPATIIVSLPASATLTIDGAVTSSTASRRVFTTPVMPAGQDFYYTLEAKYVRAGRPFVLSREVTVRADEETRVNLEAGSASVASR